MQLPPALRRAIERLAHGHAVSSLSEAAARISTVYRAAPDSIPVAGMPPKPGSAGPAVPSSAISTELDRLAYVVTRMPATYASTRVVFAAIRERLPELDIETVLDLGAGPGTASWAAFDIFPGIRGFTLLEKDRAFANLGKSLTSDFGNGALQSATWITTDMARAKLFAPHDLVVLSYSIGELRTEDATSLLNAAWNATRKVLAVIEPGTPAGFARIRTLRDELLRQAAHMIAPCPHSNVCPMVGQDWCHFAARVERSSLHRRVKGGTLGFEDEKYSYIAVSRSPTQPAEARIIRHPQHRPGFVELQLCGAEGLREITVSRRHKSAFRHARKASWGDAWIMEKPADS